MDPDSDPNMQIISDPTADPDLNHEKKLSSCAENKVCSSKCFVILCLPRIMIPRPYILICEYNIFQIKDYQWTCSITWEGTSVNNFELLFTKKIKPQENRPIRYEKTSEHVAVAREFQRQTDTLVLMFSNSFITSI